MKKILLSMMALVLSVGAWAVEDVKLSGGYNYTTSGQTRMAISQYASYVLTGDDTYSIEEYKACRVEYAGLVGTISIRSSNEQADPNKVEETSALESGSTTCTLTFDASKYTDKNKTVKIYLTGYGSTSNIVTLTAAYLIKNDDTEVALTEGKSGGWGVDFGYNGTVSFTGWGNIEMSKANVSANTYHLYTFNFTDNTSGEGKITIQVNNTDGSSTNVKIPASASTFQYAVTGSDINNIVLSDNGNTVALSYSSITREVRNANYVKTVLNSTSQEMNNLYWTQFSLESTNFTNARVGDIIRLTMNTNNEDSPKINVVNKEANAEYSNLAFPKNQSGYIFDYIIPCEAVLTELLTNGLYLRGDKLTLTEVSLLRRNAITISTAKYATFSTSDPIDFSQTAGVTAYIAKKEDNKIKLTEVTKVEANKAVILYADVDATTNYTLVTTDESTDDVSANELKVSDGSVTGDASTIYVLANGNNGVGFYLLKSGDAVAAGKAYLEIPAGGSARQFLGFSDGDETTAISTLNHEPLTMNQYYDLQGRRIAQPQRSATNGDASTAGLKKGLYIVNGKKVIIKK